MMHRWHVWTRCLRTALQVWHRSSVADLQLNCMQNAVLLSWVQVLRKKELSSAASSAEAPASTFAVCGPNTTDSACEMWATAGQAIVATIHD